MIISFKLKKQLRTKVDAERGVIKKEHGGRLSVCLVFPNSYSLAMSNLGFQTLYKLFNDMDNCVCERAVLPDKTTVEEFSRTGEKLLSFETQRRLSEFDVIAFSLSFEDDYINIIRILELCAINPLSKERSGGPLLMAG
ncbi:MAG: radical SAM protein, partial [Deltaproteobacteria bacterium]|nr:radical SAM protein [Deltaproteobacteria bacterium]